MALTGRSGLSGFVPARRAEDGQPTETALNTRSWSNQADANQVRSLHLARSIMGSWAAGLEGDTQGREPRGLPPRMGNTWN